jgi:biopolymer transport protein ExbB
MIHQLMLRIAEVGRHWPLVLIALASVVSLSIIADRAWFFWRHRFNFDVFARDLLQLVRSREWAKARQSASRSRASAPVVIATGLMYTNKSHAAVRSAMRAARAFERTRLEGQTGLLGTLGQTALLLGLLGTLLELVRLSSESGNSLATNPLLALTPAAAGLLVAIPAILISKFWMGHVRQTLRQIDALSDLVILHLPARRRRTKTEQSKSRAA